MRLNPSAWMSRFSFLGRVAKIVVALPPVAKLALLSGISLMIAALLGYRFGWAVSLLFLGVVALVAGSMWAWARFMAAKAAQGDEAFVALLGANWERGAAELKATGVDKHELGFYALIGEPQSGKSTSLKQSGLSFPIGMEEIKGSGGTVDCDWWFTDEAIILDTAGRLTFHKDQGDQAQNEAEFKEFLRRLVKHRPRCPINGVIVVIPCDSLIKDAPDEVKRKANVIRKALVDIERGVEVRFPVYVLLTKADWIGGFSEFFRRLRGVELTQIVGWSRSNERLEDPFHPEELQEAFEEVCDRFYAWRLAVLDRHGHEMGDHERERLIVFPEEFSQLRPQVERYLSHIFPDSKLVDPLFFRGFYLTSGEQTDPPVMKACAEILGQRTDSSERDRAGGEAGLIGEEDEVMADEEAELRSFFIGDFYRKKVFKERGLVRPTRARMHEVQLVQRWGYGVTGAAALIVVLLLVGLMFRVFEQVVPPEGVAKSAAAAIADWQRLEEGSKLGKRGEILGVLEELARRDKGEQLGVLFEIENGIILQAVGWFGINESDRKDLLNNLWRVYRVLLVKGVLEPLAGEISDAIGSEVIDGIRTPTQFAAYRAALASFIGVVCSDTGAAEVPGDIRPLLAYYQLRTSRTAASPAPLTDQEVDRIAAAWQMLARHAPHFFSEGLPQTAWRGTGAGELWLAGPSSSRALKRSLQAAFRVINDRWRLTFSPTHEEWVCDVPAGAALPDPGIAQQQAFHWWRMYRLEREMRESSVVLERIEGEVARDSRAHQLRLDEWEEFAKQWEEAYTRFASAMDELKERCEWQPDLTSDKAIAVLLRAWQDEFYGVSQASGESEAYSGLLGLTADQTKRHIQDWVGEARDGLQESWDEERSKFERLFSGKDRSAVAWIYSKDGKVVLGSEPQRRRAVYDATAGLVRESLWPLGGVRLPGNPWKDVLESRIDATGERTEPSLAVPFMSTSVGALLKAHSLRLDDALSIPVSEESIAIVRRNAVKAILSGVFGDLHKVHGEGVLETVARSRFHESQGRNLLDPNQEIPVQYGKGAAQHVLGDYLVPLAVWVDGMQKQHEPMANGVPLLSQLDALGSKYLDDWFGYWTSTYSGKLKSLVDQSATIEDVPALSKHLLQGLCADERVPTVANRLARYTEVALQAMDVSEFAPTGPWPLARSMEAWKRCERNLAGVRIAIGGVKKSGLLETNLKTFLEELTDGRYLATESGARVRRLLSAPARSEFEKSLAYLSSLISSADDPSRVYVPALYELERLWHHMRSLLAREVETEMWGELSLAVGKIDAGSFPFQPRSAQTVEETALNRFLGRTQEFDKFVAKYGDHLPLAPPGRRDAAGKWRQLSVDRLLPVEPVAELVDFVNSCRDLQSFLYGADKATLRDSLLRFHVERVDVPGEYTKIDNRVPAIALLFDDQTVAASLRQILVPPARKGPARAPQFEWRFDSHRRIRLVPTLAVGDNMDHGIVGLLLRDRDAEWKPVLEYADGPLALLRLLVANIEVDGKVRYGSDESSEITSTVTLTIRATYDPSRVAEGPPDGKVPGRAGGEPRPANFTTGEARLGVEFEFLNRVYPEKLPSIPNWPGKQ